MDNLADVSLCAFLSAIVLKCNQYLGTQSLLGRITSKFTRSMINHSQQGEFVTSINFQTFYCSLIKYNHTMIHAAKITLNWNCK